MPCKCDGYDEMLNNEKKQKLDQLTQDLCYICATLMTNGVLEKYASPRIIDWWKQHQKDDNARVKDTINDLMQDYYDNNEEYLTPERVADILINSAEDEHPVSDFHKKWFVIMAENYVKKFLKQEENRLRKTHAEIKRKLDEFKQT